MKGVINLEDSGIIKLYFDRNEEAIPATAEKYGAYCMTVSKNILGNNEDAEECVNDTYLVAWNTIPPQIPKILSLFLGKITRNLSLNLYRKKNAEKRGGGEYDAVLDEIAEIVSGKENTEEDFERKELISAINSFLGILDEEKRSIFICRYWYFDSVEDIAERFGKKESSVYSSLERTLKKLRKYLAERGFEI